MYLWNGLADLPPLQMSLCIHSVVTIPFAATRHFSLIHRHARYNNPPPPSFLVADLSLAKASTHRLLLSFFSHPSLLFVISF